MIGEELYLGYNLVESPIVEAYPSISNESFTEIGIPNKGGRKFFVVYSPSSKVQFFLFDCFLMNNGCDFHE